METDRDLRERIRPYIRGNTLPAVISERDLNLATGAGLDAWATKVGLNRLGTISPDPFGDRITEALRREDDVVPHPVRRVETEAEKDALWRSVEDYGRGG